jgi:hypothetical protein
MMKEQHKQCVPHIYASISFRSWRSKIWRRQKVTLYAIYEYEISKLLKVAFSNHRRQHINLETNKQVNQHAHV